MACGHDVVDYGDMQCFQRAAYGKGVAQIEASCIGAEQRLCPGISLAPAESVVKRDFQLVANMPGNFGCLVEASAVQPCRMQRNRQEQFGQVSVARCKSCSQ